MAQHNVDTDHILKRRLEAHGDADTEYWSFRRTSTRAYAHAYFQYPAMMVPHMQEELIRTIVAIDGSVKSVFDPFVGSGTVMTEAMMQGLDFTGHDINPLAILLCRAKSGPFNVRELQSYAQELLLKINSDPSHRIEADFPGLEKWFSAEVAVELSRVHRSIRAISTLWVRRFFWVCLAETVRLCSNSRTSTFKLHIRPSHELRPGRVSAANTFEQILKRNLQHYAAHENELQLRELLKADCYKGKTTLHLRDSTEQHLPEANPHLHDLLVTSPPYGDNKTTVPYGQHSYLPLQWIALEDIDSHADRSCLNTTHELDSRSLGGRLRKAVEESMALCDASVAFRRTMREMCDTPQDRRSRVAAFCLDLVRAVDAVLPALKPKAMMIWTIGNRCVGGRKIPMNEILRECLEARGAKLVCNIARPIPSKRMAVRNNVADTMRVETVLVMRSA